MPLVQHAAEAPAEEGLVPVQQIGPQLVDDDQHDESGTFGRSLAGAGPSRDLTPGEQDGPQSYHEEATSQSHLDLSLPAHESSGRRRWPDRIRESNAPWPLCVPCGGEEKCRTEQSKYSAPADSAGGAL